MSADIRTEEQQCGYYGYTQQPPLSAPPPYCSEQMPANAGYNCQPDWMGAPPVYKAEAGPDSIDGMPLFTAPAYHTLQGIEGVSAGMAALPHQQQGPYITQPMGYNMQQPAYVYVQPSPLTNPPKDYMGYSLFVTICCCWIIGLFAIMKSSECRSAIAIGDRVSAEMKSREAKKYSHIALSLGIVVLCFTAGILGIYYGLVFSRFRY